MTTYDPLTLLVEAFVESEADKHEIYCPEPGTMLEDGRRFTTINPITPEAMHTRIYNVVLRLGYLKETVWVQKQGRSTWLYKYDYRKGIS